MRHELAELGMGTEDGPSMHLSSIDSVGALDRAEFGAALTGLHWHAAAQRWLELRRSGCVELLTADGGVVEADASDVARMPTVSELIESVDAGVRHDVSECRAATTAALMDARALLRGEDINASCGIAMI